MKSFIGMTFALAIMMLGMWFVGQGFKYALAITIVSVVMCFACFEFWEYKSKPRFSDKEKDLIIAEYFNKFWTGDYTISVNWAGDKQLARLLVVLRKNTLQLDLPKKFEVYINGKKINVLIKYKTA